MTANLKQRTARIYRFPVKPRMGAMSTDMRMRADGRTVPAFPMTDFGSAWYHEAAIEKDPTAHGS